MKRLFKILLGLAGALVLLLVLAAVALPLIYDKEDLKEALAGEVYRQTGRELSIGGALDFSVFPWLAVEVNDLSLSNAKGFGDQPFAQIGQARVGVALIPLLRKQISIDEITLDELDLLLAVNAKGQNNWDDLAAGEESPVAEDSGSGLFSGKRIAGLNIRDAKVEFRDRKTGAHYRVSGLSLQTGALGDDNPVPLELTAMLEDVAAGTRADIELAASAVIGLESGQHTFDDFELNLEFEATENIRVVSIQAPQLRLDLAAQTLELDSLGAELDQSRFTGELKVQNFSRPKIIFSLSVDEFDLNHYMEPAFEEGAAGPGGTEDVVIPHQELRGSEVQGRLKVGILRMAGLEFSDAEVDVSLRNGKLRLNPLTAGFYGGSYSGDISLDGSGAVPVLSLNEKIDSITFQRLVADLLDSEAISGTAQGQAQLTGRGKTSSEMLGSLQGGLGMTLNEGALEGINIWYEIRRGMALYKGLAPPEPEPNRTVFSRMQMTADVEHGVVTARKLIGELPFLTVRGKGSIDLGQSQVNLTMVAEVRNEPELARDPLSSELGGKTLPFKISGPLEAPVLSVDWEALLKGEATDMILDKLGLGSKETREDTVEAEQEETSSQDQLEETARGLLFDLLGGKDKEKDKDGG